MAIDKIELTGNDVDFMFLKVAHDLPETRLATWTFHDKGSKDGGRFLRCTAVVVLTPDGKFFIGISTCSETEPFDRKDGFNRAYGRALKKLTAFQRYKGDSDGYVTMAAPIGNINRWLASAAYNAKLEEIKRIWADRFRIAKMKGHDAPILP